MKAKVKTVLNICIYVLLFVSSMLLTLIFTGYSFFDISKNKITEAYFYIPTYDFPSNKELAMVFITSPACAFSNSEAFIGYVELSKLNSKLIAELNNADFSAIGVVVNWVVHDGMEHIKKFGYFDEISVDRNWINSGAREFIHNDVRSKYRASVPQIVLVFRDLNIVLGQDRNTYEIISQQELARFIGVDEIIEFAKSNDFTSYIQGI